MVVNVYDTQRRGQYADRLQTGKRVVISDSLTSPVVQIVLQQQRLTPSTVTTQVAQKRIEQNYVVQVGFLNATGKLKGECLRHHLALRDVDEFMLNTVFTVRKKQQDMEGISLSLSLSLSITRSITLTPSRRLCCVYFQNLCA
jgi:outer membrane phospholipase A